MQKKTTAAKWPGPQPLRTQSSILPSATQIILPPRAHLVGVNLIAGEEEEEKALLCPDERPTRDGRAGPQYQG